MKLQPEKAMDPGPGEILARLAFRDVPLLRKRIREFELTELGHELPISHMQILDYLEREGPTLASELAQALDVARPNITAIIDKMVGEALVKRVRACEDRRAVFIQMEPEGLRRLQEVRGAVSERLNAWRQEAGEVRYQRFVAAVDDVRAAMDWLMDAQGSERVVATKNTTSSSKESE